MSQQNRNPKTAKNSTANARPAAPLPAFVFPLILVVILAILFFRSYMPGYIHFSNDGPLGEQNTAWSLFPGTMTGSWDDLNDIGQSVGAVAPDITTLERWFLGPVGFCKFSVPFALFVVGISAWTFFRQLKLSPLAAALGALATSLNSGYVGNACWGTVSQQIAIAMVFLALALVMANTGETPRLVRWSRYALAGMAVGVSIMEGADNGAIFSLFVAAYVFFKSVTAETAPLLQRIGWGIGRVAVIAVFAALIAAQTIASLVGAFVVGQAGMNPQDQMDAQEHWDWATQWSLPKAETLGVVVPGVFGYRMDTPKDMITDSLQDDYFNGEYWGGMGRTPEIDRFFDSGATGKPPGGMMRFGYAGYYAGILVALIALFAIVQSLRRENSIFLITERHFVWFWTAALLIALLLSYGRFAPFYQLLYKLPYFSTIRNPGKFMAIFQLTLIIIFGYGMDALVRRYFQPRDARADAKPGEAKSWWANISLFDRGWMAFCIVVLIFSVLGWAVYKSDGADMVQYLKKVGFPEDHAKTMFAFSVGQVKWFLLYLAGAVVLLILVLAGVFSGKRAAIVGGLLFGLFFVLDLGRADLPFIIRWDYQMKCDIDPTDLAKSTNPVITFLCDKPYEHRVTDFQSSSLFEDVYRLEWMQHHFPYYDIQCIDLIQSSRVASDLARYEDAMRPTSEQDAYVLTRRWELESTDYFFGPTSFLDSINDQFDPQLRRFHVAQRFNIVPKPGVDVDRLQMLFESGIFVGEALTAVTNDSGEFALFNFSGALPRAKLYGHWQVGTNANDVLKTLTAPNFDPQQTVLVSGPLPGVPATSAGDNSGSVDYKTYAPKDIVLNAQVVKPSVLLLNDKYDPHWTVSVDGQPAQLFRANYIMRGVYLPSPGSHTVEFKFEQPHGPLYVTLTAMGGGIFLCGFLFSTARKPELKAKK